MVSDVLVISRASFSTGHFGDEENRRIERVTEFRHGWGKGFVKRVIQLRPIFFWDYNYNYNLTITIYLCQLNSTQMQWMQFH